MPCRFTGVLSLMGGGEEAVTVSFIYHVSFLYLNMSASAIPLSSELREELRFIFLSVVMES